MFEATVKAPVVLFWIVPAALAVKLIPDAVDVIVVAPFDVIASVPVPDDAVVSIVILPLLVLRALPFKSRGLNELFSLSAPLRRKTA